MSPLALGACSTTTEPDSGPRDGGAPDARPGDSGLADAGFADAGQSPDAGAAPSLAAPLEAVRANTLLPSLGALALTETETLESAATGVRKLGDPTPVTVDDLFHIGSNTKAMTATLVATFVEDGTWTWQTTVEDVLGAAVSDLHPEQRGLDLLALLSHGAGIIDDDAFGLLAELPADATVPQLRALLASVVLRAPPTGTQGSYAYSNVGYIIVGAMLEAQTGSSWEDLMRQRLFEPLEMASCGFYAPGTPGQVGLPWGHANIDGVPTPLGPGHPDADLHPAIGPAGLVHCTMADWARFLSMHLRGARGSGTELLSAASFTRMHTAQTGDYALGWIALQTPGGRALFHDGSNLRFTSNALILPESDWAALIVTNLSQELAAADVNAALQALLTRHGLQ